MGPPCSSSIAQCQKKKKTNHAPLGNFKFICSPFPYRTCLKPFYFCLFFLFGQLHWPKKWAQKELLGTFLMSSLYPPSSFRSSLPNLVEEVTLKNLFKSPPPREVASPHLLQYNLLENYILVFHKFVEENDNLTKELKLWAEGSNFFFFFSFFFLEKRVQGR